MDNCIFCSEEFKRKRVKESKHCYAIFDSFPVSKGHLLIISKDHFDDWFTTPLEVQEDALSLINTLKEEYTFGTKPDGFNIGMNCGAAAGQTVMHLHIHLIPRYNGDMEDPRGGVRGVIPSKQKY